MEIEKRFSEFIAIMYRLRKECPWDRVQTNDSIKAATIEEAYEVVHAIDEQNYDELKKELGDLLLHFAFHSIIAEESGHFTLEEAIKGISEKLIRRHPHIFGDVNAQTAEEVKANWEKIKMDEGRTSVLEGIPKHMPALLRAYRIQDKASKVGFDWTNKEDVWNKVKEELSEFEAEIAANKMEKAEEEFGDLLFALTNYSRFIKINPEDALRKTITKFETRFRFIEDELAKDNRKVHETEFSELDRLWNESKKRT